MLTIYVIYVVEPYYALASILPPPQSPATPHKCSVRIQESNCSAKNSAGCTATLRTNVGMHRSLAQTWIWASTSVLNQHAHDVFISPPGLVVCVAGTSHFLRSVLWLIRNLSAMNRKD